MQVALHVTMRPNGAKASNRVSVSGGVTGMFDSQEELSQDASDGVDFGSSSSSPEEVGKANKERAGWRGAGAGALRKQKREGVAWFGAGTLKALVGAIVLASSQQFSASIDWRVMQMSMIRISAAAGRVNGVPHASMQVALHVTMRQNGAKASNRVSVSGGVTGMFDSQEELSQDASDGGFNRWSGDFNTSGTPG
jgi:hypothetical protein